MDAAGSPADQAEPVVSVRGLRMAYGEFEAVRGIDLEVHRGEVFAFLGPNGAGKTTTLEVMEGYRKRTGGEVSVLGVDPGHAGSDWRERIGVVLQESEVEPELTVRECLQLYAGYYRAPRPVEDTIALAGLSEKADTRGARLSGGQRRRLDVALALIGDPELVFLDEPTTGFDPLARRAAWDVIAGLQALGKTIFLTTHYMEEAEHLADRICVIAAGVIVAEGTPQTLGGRDSARSEISFTLPAGADANALPPSVAAAISDAHGGRLVLASHEPLEILGALSVWAREHGHALADIDVHRPTLEDTYLKLTEPPT
jgi:ABC-2 type transport system ATP-binding protein